MDTLRARLRALLPDREVLSSLGRAPRRDLAAGLTVAVVALPLALGFGISSGAGAEAGLATAVVGGTLAALFGGSHLQVTGSSGAMTVILVPIIRENGLNGVLTCGLLAGCLLLLLALLRAGRWMAYVPVPVVEGFTLGVAGVIALQQVPHALGVATPTGDHPGVVAYRAARAWLTHPQPAAVALSLGVCALMLAGARWRGRLPWSLLGVVAATLAAWAFALPVAVIGPLPDGLPLPTLGFLHLDDPAALLPDAAAIAALAALESLMSASAADSMRGGAERHDSDRELFGQGLANLVTPLFGGVPASGAMARTAVNVRAGAVSRLAAVVHAVALAVVVLLASPLVAQVPLAALAGVLLAASLRMADLGALRALAGCGRGEAAVIAVTAAATLALDLVAAVLVGLGIAAVLALRQISRTAGVHVRPAPEGVCVYDLDGPLLFAGARRVQRLVAEAEHAPVVLLRLAGLRALDASGARALGETVAELERRGTRVLLVEVPEPHARPLTALGLLTPDRTFPTTAAALKAASGA